MNSLNRVSAPHLLALSGLYRSLYGLTPEPLLPVEMQWIAVRQRSITSRHLL